MHAEIMCVNASHCMTLSVGPLQGSFMTDNIKYVDLFRFVRTLCMTLDHSS